MAGVLKVAGPSAAPYPIATTLPIAATAIKLDMRITALLIPDAVPVACGATEPITAVDRGATTKPMPMPCRHIAGITAPQKF